MAPKNRNAFKICSVGLRIFLELVPDEVPNWDEHQDGNPRGTDQEKEGGLNGLEDKPQDDQNHQGVEKSSHSPGALFREPVKVMGQDFLLGDDYR